MTEWIKYNNSNLPEPYKRVLIFGKCGILLGFRDHLHGPCWYTCPEDDYISGITHWAQLPEAPLD